MNKSAYRILFFIFIILLNIGCDQVTKSMAKKYLVNAGYVQVVGDIFVLKYAVNDGAFLGIFHDIPRTLKLIVLGIIPSAVLFVLFFYSIFSRRITSLHLAGYACIIGGGMSNLIDRLFNNGFVVDFMNFGLGGISSRFRTGILNVADLSILVGIIFLLFAFRKDKKREKEAQPV